LTKKLKNSHHKNMIQTHIWITQTIIEENWLNALVAYNFLEKSDESEKGQQNERDQKKISEKDLEIAKKSFITYQNNGQILTPNLTSKSDFKEYSLGLYKTFPTKTLLFLGSLSDYSIQVQEGMLKLLEEPPQNLIICLYVKNQSELLPTILSRSQIHTISDEVIKACLSTGLIEKVKKLFPSPSQTLSKILSNNSTDFLDEVFKNIAKVERNEIDFWLWQLEYYCVQSFQQKPHDYLTKTLFNIQKARKLNSSSVQKKLAILQAFTGA